MRARRARLAPRVAGACNALRTPIHHFDFPSLQGIGLTAELIGKGAAAIEIVEGQGDSRMERLVSLVLLGDLLSIYLAVLRGADPAEIDVLHELKARLSPS